MKAAIESPTAMLHEYSAMSNFHVALAHLVLDDMVYREFYKEMSARGDYVMLDNSVVELGSSASLRRLLTAALMVGAQEIILPDVLRDGTLTVFSTTQALSQLEELPPQRDSYKLCAVPQGATSLEWLDCYGALVKLPVDVIGIPKVLDDVVGTGGREKILEILRSLELVDYTKEYHLLGVWSDPLEVLRCAQRFSFVRSVDSSLPVLAGLRGRRFPDPLMSAGFERPSTPMDFGAEEDPHPDITKKNCELFIWWASGKAL